MKRSAGTEAFDLYVVDVNMPKMDGYSFVRELRRLAPPVAAGAGADGLHRIAGAGRHRRATRPAPTATWSSPCKPAELVLTAALLLGDRRRRDGAAAGRIAAGARRMKTSELLDQFIQRSPRRAGARSAAACWRWNATPPTPNC
jgi:CheY-like chemotaxis protein